MATNLLTGTIQSGGTTNPRPLADVPVTLYEATENAPLPVGSAKTDADSKFSGSGIIDADVNPNTGNPGGDGIVIFVGLAKPPIKKH